MSFDIIVLGDLEKRVKKLRKELERCRRSSFSISLTSLGQLLSVLGVRDEVVPGAADTLAAAQAAGGKAGKDEDQDMLC